MEQSKIGQFFKPAPPDALRVLTLTRMRHAPKAKRPVERPWKRVAVDHVVPASPLKGECSRRVPQEADKVLYHEQETRL